MKTPELLPCPFCGGEAKLVKSKSKMNDTRIQCKKCGIKTGWWMGEPAELIEQWNNRVYPEEELPDGTKITVCGENANFEICAECGQIADILCDFPIGGEKTCDRKLCEKCAVEIAPNLHYCKPHFEMWKKFEESGGVKNVLENVIPFKRIKNHGISK